MFVECIKEEGYVEGNDGNDGDGGDDGNDGNDGVEDNDGDDGDDSVCGMYQRTGVCGRQ